MASVIENKLMTIAEVAERLGVTVQRTHQLIETYAIPTVVVNPRMKLVSKVDVEKLANIPRPTGVHIGRQKKSPSKPKRS